MVAWWPLDGLMLDGSPAGAVVVDWAGGDNNGIAIGAPVKVQGNYVVNSLNFYSGSYVEVPNAPNLNFGKSDFTIDAWVRFGIQQYSQTEPIVYKLGGNGEGYSLYIQEIGIWNTFRLTLRIGNTVYQGPIINPPNNPPQVGRWIFVAATRNGNTVRLYVGVDMGSYLTPLAVQQTIDPVIQDATNSTPLRIGGWPPTNTNPASISIDEVEIFDRNLPQPELDKIYQARKQGKIKCAFP
jgi:hypothetical protein